MILISSTAKAQASRSEGFLWSDIKQMTIPGTCCRCFLPCILPILKWPSRSLGAGSHSVHEVICKDWGSIQGFKSTQNILNSLQLYSPEALDDIAQEGCNCLNIVLWPRMMTNPPPSIVDWYPWSQSSTYWRTLTITGRCGRSHGFFTSILSLTYFT